MIRTISNAELGVRWAKEFTVWPTYKDYRLNIVFVETWGHTPDDYCDNATIHLEDWHGNEFGCVDFDDLHAKDQDLLIEEFSKVWSAA